MTAIAQLRLVAPAETRASVVPDAQIINLTIENDEKLLLTVVEAAHRLGIGRTLMYELLSSRRGCWSKKIGAHRPTGLVSEGAARNHPPGLDPSGRSLQTVLVSEQRSACMRWPRVIDAKGIAMSESIDDTPVADDEVEEILADEESDEEAARSLPEEGSDDDPGSMINR